MSDEPSAGPNPEVKKTYSPLRAQLEAIAAAKAAQPVQPGPPRPIIQPSQPINEREGIGSGTVPPGGTKIA